jgi:hypothetical protein
VDINGIREKTKELNGKAAPRVIDAEERERPAPPLEIKERKFGNTYSEGR